MRVVAGRPLSNWGFGFSYCGRDVVEREPTRVSREVFPEPLGPTRRKVGRVVEVVER